MVDGNGGAILDPNTSVPIYRISFQTLVPLGTTTFPLTLSPASSCIYGMGDALVFTASVQDSSGNSGMSLRARKIVLGSGFIWGD